MRHLRLAASWLCMCMGWTGATWGATPDATPAPGLPVEGKPLGDLTLHEFAAKWMAQQDDLAEIGRYRAENLALPPAGGRVRVVMMGDSITFHWGADALPAPPQWQVVNRGIAGQNTSQMLLRPAAVVLLGGTNDLRAYSGDPAAAGPAMFDRIARNVTAMVDIAQARGVKVVLCAVPPITAQSARVARDPATIVRVNAWLKAFAAARGVPFADYHAALSGPAGDLPPSLSVDGLHPNAAGYRLMWLPLQAALRALGLPGAAAAGGPSQDR